MTTDELIKNALELCGTRYEVEAGLKHRLLSELAHALARAEAERDAQHDLVLRLTAERDAVSVVHACPPKGSGVMPCCGATPFEKQGERLTADPALVNCDRQRLIAENARLQKEHDAYVQRLSADALQIAADTVRLRANPDHVNRIVESASIYARGLGATPETLVFAGLSLALESLPPGKLRGVLELAQWIAQRRADWELSAKGEL